MEATWQLSPDRPCLILVSLGASVLMNAAEIYDAEFEGQRQRGMLSFGRPSDDIQSITFSPYLHELSFRLRSCDSGEVMLVAIVGPSGLSVESWPDTDYVIGEGEWLALDMQSLRSYQEALTNKGIGLGGPLDASQVLWLLWNPEIDVTSEVSNEQLVTGVGTTGRKHYDPSVLRATLYPYQVVGSQYLAQMVDMGMGALLADEMGLGKTMQALYAVSRNVRAGSRPHLVVAPSSTLANWEREASRFAPVLRVALHLGANRTGDPAVLREGDLVITSYETAVRDRSLLDSIDWDIVVLDEAQAIKNPKAQRSQAVKSFPRRSGIAVTGTPIENSLTDLWSVLEFVAPEYLGSIDDFEYLYPDRVDAAKTLSTKVAPLVLRRTVASVASDLPPRVDVVSPVYASGRLAAVYEEVRLANLDVPIVALTRLRQLCAAPSLADTSWGSITEDFPKFERLIEIIESVVAAEAKALVFASFTESIDQIQAGIKLHFPDVPVFTVDGRLPSWRRQSLIDEFSALRGSGVLVLNPRAAGVGLNIQAANYVVHFTPEWNPAVVSQASARAHRRGQTRPVFVYYLYYAGTVEEVMMDRLDGKRDLQEAGLSEVSSEPKESDVATALRLSPLQRGIN